MVPQWLGTHRHIESKEAKTKKTKNFGKRKQDNAKISSNTRIQRVHRGLSPVCPNPAKRKACDSSLPTSLSTSFHKMVYIGLDTLTPSTGKLCTESNNVQNVVKKLVSYMTLYMKHYLASHTHILASILTCMESLLWHFLLVHCPGFKFNCRECRGALSHHTAWHKWEPSRVTETVCFRCD